MEKEELESLIKETFLEFINPLIEHNVKVAVRESCKVLRLEIASLKESLKDVSSTKSKRQPPSSEDSSIPKTFHDLMHARKLLRTTSQEMNDFSFEFNEDDGKERDQSFLPEEMESSSDESDDIGGGKDGNNIDFARKPPVVTVHGRRTDEYVAKQFKMVTAFLALAAESKRNYESIHSGLNSKVVLRIMHFIKENAKEPIRLTSILSVVSASESVQVRPLIHDVVNFLIETKLAFTITTLFFLYVPLEDLDISDVPALISYKPPVEMTPECHIQILLRLTALLSLRLP